MRNERIIFDKYKNYFSGIEKSTDYILRTSEHTVIRLDGVKFTGKILKKNKIKYDNGYFMAMKNTAKKIMEKNKGIFLTYVCNDEFSFIIDSTKVIENDYNRIQKMVTKTASMATLYLVQELMKIREEKYEDLIENAVFAGKAFNVEKEKLNNYLAWRQISTKIALISNNEPKDNNNEWKNLGAFIYYGGDKKKSSVMVDEKIDLENKKITLSSNRNQIEIKEKKEKNREKRD